MTATHAGHFRIAREDIVSEEFDGEFVILDLESGKYFALNESAGAVWKALRSGYSFEDIARRLHTDVRRQALGALVDEFLGHGLMVPGGAGTTPSGEVDADRLDGEFELQLFDDLADLLAADPIHDVDRGAGWPHKPT